MSILSTNITQSPRAVKAPPLHFFRNVPFSSPALVCQPQSSFSSQFVSLIVVATVGVYTCGVNLKLSYFPFCTRLEDFLGRSTQVWWDTWLIYQFTLLTSLTIISQCVNPALRPSKGQGTARHTWSVTSPPRFLSRKRSASILVTTVSFYFPAVDSRHTTHWLVGHGCCLVSHYFHWYWESGCKIVTDLMAMPILWHVCHYTGTPFFHF